MPLLREILHVDLSPLVNNIAASQVMVVAFKIAVEGIGRWHSRFGQTMYTRQFCHILLSAGVVFWPLFDTEDWSWRLNALVPAVMMARFFYKVRVTCHADTKTVNAFIIFETILNSLAFTSYLFSA
jgi:hypothetical protein